MVGDTPLLSHGWDPRTLQEIADKQGGKAQNKKGPKDPHREACGGLYWLDESGNRIWPGTDPLSHPHGFGVPTSAFRKAMVEAGYQMGGQKKTQLRTPFRFVGTYAKIEGKCRQRSGDPVRVKGSMDIRYRMEFTQWSCRLKMVYDANIITPEQIANLLANAGFGVGVGDWRPEKNGTFGCFRVTEVRTYSPQNQ